MSSTCAKGRLYIWKNQAHQESIYKTLTCKDFSQSGQLQFTMNMFVLRNQLIIIRFTTKKFFKLSPRYMKIIVTQNIIIITKYTKIFMSSIVLLNILAST